MQHKYALEAVDRCLRDIRSSTNPFGGITIVFGDFQQKLPVVPHGRQEEIILATIQRSYLWRAIHVLHFSKNMRIVRDEHAHVFAPWLLAICRGQQQRISDSVNGSLCLTLPREIICHLEEDLIDSVYHDFSPEISCPPP